MLKKSNLHNQELNMVTVRLLQVIFPPEGLQPESQGHSSAEIVTVDTILEEKSLIKQENYKFKYSSHVYGSSKVQILLLVLSTLQHNKLRVADFSEWETVGASLLYGIPMGVNLTSSYFHSFIYYHNPFLGPPMLQTQLWAANSTWKQLRTLLTSS